MNADQQIVSEVSKSEMLEKQLHELRQELRKLDKYPNEESQFKLEDEIIFKNSEIQKEKEHIKLIEMEIFKSKHNLKILKQEFEEWKREENSQIERLEIERLILEEKIREEEKKEQQRMIDSETERYKKVLKLETEEIEGLEGEIIEKDQKIEEIKRVIEIMSQENNDLSKFLSENNNETIQNSQETPPNQLMICDIRNPVTTQDFENSDSKLRKNDHKGLIQTSDFPKTQENPKIEPQKKIFSIGKPKKFVPSVKPKPKNDNLEDFFEELARK